jgi:hypothetical protein
MTDTRADRIRALIADDHIVVRAGLRAFPDLDSALEVVGTATTGAEAVCVAHRMRLGACIRRLHLVQLRSAPILPRVRVRNWQSSKLLHGPDYGREVLLHTAPLFDRGDLVGSGRSGEWHLMFLRKLHHIAEVLPHQAQRELSRILVGADVLQLDIVTCHTRHSDVEDQTARLADDI